jgi:hypothetical protein
MRDSSSDDRASRHISGETSTQRQVIKISFHGRGWQTLTVEVARPEGTRGGEPEVVLAAISPPSGNSPSRLSVLSKSSDEMGVIVHDVTDRCPGTFFAVGTLNG